MNGIQEAEGSIPFSSTIIKPDTPSLRNTTAGTAFWAGIEKLKTSLQEKFDSYQKLPQSLTAGMATLHRNSRDHKFLKASVNERGLLLELDEAAIAARKKRLGKNLLFTSQLDAATEWVITQYKEKNVIEDAFKTMKDPEMIRLRPLRHWTDTKIRAYVFWLL